MYKKHLSEPWFSLVHQKKKTSDGRLNKGDFKAMNRLNKEDIIEFFNNDSDVKKYRVKVIGNRVAIGAINNRDNGHKSGHVKVYRYDEGDKSWLLMGEAINGEHSYDESGHSVSMNAAGDRVAIGAPYNGGNGDNIGHVKVYEYVGGAWSPMGGDIDSEHSYDWSGWSVSMNADGDRVAIGAIYTVMVMKNDHTNYDYRIFGITKASLLNAYKRVSSIVTNIELPHYSTLLNTSKPKKTKKKSSAK